MTKHGQGLVEFALIMPILLLLMAGIIDFGWVVFNYIQLNNGVREALRYGSVPGLTATNQYRDCAGIYKTLKNTAAYSGLKDTNITVYYDNGYSTGVDDTVNVTGKCTLPGPYTGNLINGQRIVVEVKVTVKFLTPILDAFWPGGLDYKYLNGRTLYPNVLNDE